MAKRSRSNPGLFRENALAILRSLRPHQWIKNSLVFVPLALGGLFFEPDAWSYAILGFISLCFAASATYIINDLRDLESDRRHASKKHRAIASGAVSRRTAIVLAALLLVATAVTGILIGPEELGMLGIYLVVSLSYTFYWKQIPIADIFVIAALFTLRIALGILILDVRISPWLLIFSMFVFLSLSAAKRHTELLRSRGGKGTIAGRGYVRADAELVLALGIAAMLGAVLINVFYLLEDAFPRSVYSEPQWLWTIPPIIFLFLSRVWLLSHRGQLLDDPVAFALKDRISLLLGALLTAGFLAAVFG